MKSRSNSILSSPAILLGAALAFVMAPSARAEDQALLKPERFAHHVERFNTMEDENVTNSISNTASWEWMKREIPMFECPDRMVEEMYYFRWWSFRKHLVETTNGWVITEFLTPVKHAGAFNTISCAASFHIAEGRWLRNPKYVDDDILFWLRGKNGGPQPHFHKFSSWMASAILDRCAVTGDGRFTTNLLPDLIGDYRVWESERRVTNAPLKGMFWQFDVRDGMEESISGARKSMNVRPTINSYMFANAKAIAAIAQMAGAGWVLAARAFDARAENLRGLVTRELWNTNSQFFEVRREDGSFANVREELGYIPWMFKLPGKDAQFAAAWSQLTDPKGFAAPAGIMTAERRHPQFRSHGVGTCEWDGAVWPFATCQTLNALANVLRDYPQDIVTRSNYFDAFLTYTRSQHADGKPYIGEYLDEQTGVWINGKNGRSRYYNHSTYADLLITGVVGLVPHMDGQVEISPLLPQGTWDYFCLDGILYHGRRLTIVWDKNGTRYGLGKGLVLLADGREIARIGTLSTINAKLP